MELEDAIDRLDRDIKRLKIDFERFFNGNLATPPEQLRYNIQSQIQALRSVHIRSLAYRFRVNNLEAKFNTFIVLFNRRLRELESGTYGRRATAEDSSPRLDPQAGVVIGERPAPEAVEALFAELHRQDGNRRLTDLGSFEEYLQGQAGRIRRKTGCTEVQFRVTSEGGKIKLKAKPLPTEG